MIVTQVGTSISLNNNFSKNNTDINLEYQPFLLSFGLDINIQELIKPRVKNNK
ncbi:MAG: hypothetical protein IPP48_05120 [Chitinophagaceae bacterium]|nr:hypothetical protein [Chitinophagaceae bacterium]